MKKYRVSYSHCGDASNPYGTYHFNSDKEARKWLAKEKKKKSNRFGILFMDRIDVEEKTTPINE